MTLPTHLALGGIIGSLTGQPLTALVVSCLVDADHIITYARRGLLSQPRKLWQAMTRTEDPYRSQRGYLHSVALLAVVGGLAWLLPPAAGWTLVFAYLGHLALDALDDAEYWPLYPLRKFSIRGPVPFCSPGEGVVLIVFIITNVYLWL